MPTVTVSGPRQLCPPGVHRFRLTDVVVRYKPDFNDPTKEVEKWIWEFTSNEAAPDGTFYRIGVWTGTRYGDGRADLTKLLDQIVPGITKDQADSLNTDDLIGIEVDGLVKHAPSTKNPSDIWASFVWLQPIKQGADVSDEPDPFADGDAGSVDLCEECGKELTSAEIKACQKRWGDAMRLCTKHGKAALQQEQAEAASV